MGSSSSKAEALLSKNRKAGSRTSESQKRAQLIKQGRLCQCNVLREAVDAANVELAVLRDKQASEDVTMELQMANMEIETLRAEVAKLRTRVEQLEDETCEKGLRSLHDELAYERARADRAFAEGVRSVKGTSRLQR